MTIGETIGEGTFGKVKKALHIITQEKVDNYPKFQRMIFFRLL